MEYKHTTTMGTMRNDVCTSFACVCVCVWGGGGGCVCALYVYLNAHQQQTEVGFIEGFYNGAGKSTYGIH